MSNKEEVNGIVYENIDDILNYLVSKGDIDNELLPYIVDFINSNTNCKSKLEEYIIKYPLTNTNDKLNKENIIRYRSLIYEDGIKRNIVKYPNKYPLEFVYIIAMKLHYSYGTYSSYNPCSLYETLFSLFNNSFEDVTIVWNNPKIAKMEVRQVLSHHSMKNRKHNYQYYLDNDNNTNKYWINIRDKLPYTGYMFPNYTNQEIKTLIKEIHPHLIGKEIRTWCSYAILKVNETNITYVDTWDK